MTTVTLGENEVIKFTAFDAEEIRKNFDAGEYMVVIAITAEDKLAIYHSETMLPEKGGLYGSANPQPAPAAGATRNSFSVSYDRCCCQNNTKKGGEFGGNCCCVNRPCPAA